MLPGNALTNSAAGGVTDLAVIGSSPNTFGATISGTTLTLQPADGTNGGVLTAGAQNIGGLKTFTSFLTASQRLAVSASTITATTAATNRLATFAVSSTGVVTSGTDTLIGQDIDVTRTGATGGTINTIGVDIDLVTDNAGAGTSTATGLRVALDGNADTNYAAIFTGGNVGIGTAAPAQTLDVTGTAVDIASGAVAAVNGTATSVTNNQGGLISTLAVSPSAASTQSYAAIFGLASTSSTNLTGASIAGVAAQVVNSGSGTIEDAVAFNANSPISGGTINDAIGINIEAQNVAGVVEGWGIYSEGVGDYNYFAGTLGVGADAVPDAGIEVERTTEQLRLSYDNSNYASFLTGSSGDLTVTPSGGDFEIAGNASTTGTLTVTDLATFNGGLTVAAGENFINAGSTLLTAISITDDTDGGVLGDDAASTVDIATTINVTQTTASQTFTLDTPATATAGRIVYINSLAGNATFTIEGQSLAAGDTAAFMWDGSAWNALTNSAAGGVSIVGAIDGGSYSANGASISGTTIYLQTASDTEVGLVNTGAQTFGGAKTFDSLITGQAGLAVTGAAVDLNVSSNFTTNINTGTSTGAVNIGNSAAGAIAIQSATTVGLTGTTTITGLTTGDALVVSNSTSTGDILNLNDNVTTVLTVADGGAATFQNSADTTSGFQVLDADGGTPVLIVDTTNERVGIGTAAPQYPLEVVGEIRGTTIVAQSGTSYRASIGTTSGDGYLQLRDTTPTTTVNITAGSSDSFLNGLGNFGIGDAAPGAKLEVDTDDGDDEIALLVTQDDVTNNNTALSIANAGTGNSLEIDGTDFIVDASGNVTSAGTYTLGALGTTDNASFVCRNTASNVLAGCNVTPLSGSLADNTTDALDIQEDTNNYFNINTTDASENISFGNTTTNPSYDFLGTGTVTIAGDTIINETLTVNATSGTVASFNASAGQARVDIDATGTNVDSQLTLGLDSSTYFSLGLDDSNLDAFVLSASDTLGTTNRLLIDSSGNIGVGTNSPATKLDVVGSTGAQLRLRNTSTDATNKTAILQGGHYTNAEEDSTAFYLLSESSDTTLSIGGGYGSQNAATQVALYTAADNTTLQGTARVFIDSTGNVGIGNGVTTPAALLDINGEVLLRGLASAPSVSGVNQGTYYYDNTDDELKVSLNGAGFVDLATELSSSESYVISFDGTNYYAKSPRLADYTDTTAVSVVESALLALNTDGGGTITFTEGTFDLGTDNIVINSRNDIVFEGQGIDATIIENSSTAAADTEPLSFTNSKRITVRDLTINAGGTARQSSDALDFDAGEEILVERVKITGSRGAGIIFDGKDAGATAQRNIVRDCIITGTNGDGIEFLGSSHNTVTGCLIYDTVGHGIQATKASSGASQANKPSNYNIFSNNDIENAGQDGINILSSNYNVVEGNIITNSADDTASKDGVRLQSADSIACDYNSIIGNTLRDDQGTKTQRYGINVSTSDCSNTYLADNQVEGNNIAGINDSGTNTVYANQLGEGADADLQVQAAGTGSILLQSDTDITGTLTVSALATFNGGLTVAAGENFINAGSTLLTAIPISNDVDGGVLGDDAASTVDIATTLNVTQTTASQVFTLDTPATATAGRIVYINSLTGNATFTIEGQSLAAGDTAAFMWDGSAWNALTNSAAGGVTALGTIGASPNTFGGTISGTTLTLQPADGTNGGVLTAAAQNIGGAKTFNANTTVTVTDNYALLVEDGSSTDVLWVDTSTPGVYAEGIFYAAGGVINLNVSSNNPTNINTGTSTGAVTIGNALNTVNIVGDLDVSGTIANTADERLVDIAGAFTGTADDVAGARIVTTFDPSTSSDIDVYGLLATPSNSNGNLSSSLDILSGVGARPEFTGTGTLGNLVGFYAQPENNSTGTVTNAYGIQSADPFTTAGVFANAAGIQIDEIDAATNNTNLLIGTATIPSNEFSIYNASTADNVFAGDLRIGDTTAPTEALEVAGNGLLTGDLAVNGGDITTTQTTFNLVNTTATTVNAFGAATTINAGVTGGTVNLASDTLYLGSSGNAARLTSVGSDDLYIQTATQAAAATNSGGFGFGTGAVGGAGSNSGYFNLATGNSTSSGNTGSLSVYTGNATSGNSGSVTIDAGAASGSAGSVQIGTSNASALTLGRTGITSTNAGAFTVTELLTVNGGITIDAESTSTGDDVYFSDVSFTTCTALETVAGILTCGSDAGDTPVTLQDAYDAGQTILTDDDEGDLAITVAEATDFSINVTGTGAFRVQDGGTDVLTIADGGGVDVAGTTELVANAANSITGSITPAGSVYVTGVGTAFLSELEIGDRITVNSETRTIVFITDDENLEVFPQFTAGSADATLTRTPAILRVLDNASNVSLIASSDGRVGIGTGPAYTLDVYGTATEYGDGDQNGIAVIGGTLAGTTERQAGLVVNPQVNPGSEGSGPYNGIVSQIQSGSTIIGDAAISGFRSIPQVSGTADVTQLNGYTTELEQYSSATIANVAGFRVEDLINSGTITNTYGLYVGDITTGTQTNGAHGVYVSDANANNYFAGNVGIGVDTPTADLSFGEDADQTINVVARSTAADGRALTVSAGAGGTGGTTVGGNLVLNGGAAGSGNANGGNVIISGGALSGTGVLGTVSLAPTTFIASMQQDFTGSAVITQSNIDSFSTILISSDASGYTATLSDPTVATAGRVIYITNSGSFDMTLVVNGGGTGNTVTLKPNATATMIWNGADWTAAGASSSTDLQAAYDNTATSAGGAELVLNASGGAADGLTIRNNVTTPLTGSLFEVQSEIATNLFSVNNAGTEFVANGGAEDSTTFSTAWTAVGSSVITEETVDSDIATGRGSVQVDADAIGEGVRNNLATDLAISTTYQVSFTAKLDVAGTFDTLLVEYTPTGATSGLDCTNLLATPNHTVDPTGEWTKITCELTTDATAVSNADLLITQTDATTRTFHVDNLSIRENSASSTPPNVQIGGGQFGGAVTLFTLDQASAPPVASGDSTYYGSMYYDTVTGRIQCYESDGWGACGAPPNNIITITPEYAGAVLNGTGIGTMSADFCANTTGVLEVNSSVCGTDESRNYYEWTSPQATNQTYSVYLAYQLPTTFQNFADNSTITIDGYTTDTADASITYELFRETDGGAITECGSDTTVTTTNTTWETREHSGDEFDGCSFAANDRIIFKINMTARNTDSVYVSDINFTYTND